MDQVRVQVEMLTEFEGSVVVRGFAFDEATGSPPDLSFVDRRNGCLLQALGPFWYPRPDVAAVHSLADESVGFRVTLATGALPGDPAFDLHQLEIRCTPRTRVARSGRMVSRTVDRTIGRAAEVVELPGKVNGAARRLRDYTDRSGRADVAFDLIPSALDSEDPSNRLVNGFLERLGELGAGAAVLEIGSRARSGLTRRHLIDAGAEYLGLDVMAGPNVDLVGDAHQLSKILPLEHFTHAFAISVWEHLLSPWKVSIELNAVLQVGAEVMIGTHQSWPVHDDPSDYWRYSQWAWKALFNEDTGFEIVESAMGIPGSVVADVPMVGTVGLAAQPAFLSSSVVARKTGPARVVWDAETDGHGATYYPA